MQNAHSLIFENFYKNHWHQPYLLWALSTIFLVYFLFAGQNKLKTLTPAKRRFLKYYLLIFSIITLLDAWLSATPVPLIGSLSGYASSVLPLAFVLLGDFRYFLITNLFRKRGNQSQSLRVAKAIAWTFLVPVSSWVFIKFLPSNLSQNPRVLFLSYELMFFALALFWYFKLLTKTEPALRSITSFVLVYYGLWATADLILLFTQSDYGFLLRLIPNILYYCGLLPFIFFRSTNESARLA